MNHLDKIGKKAISIGLTLGALSLTSLIVKDQSPYFFGKND